MTFITISYIFPIEDSILDFGKMTSTDRVQIIGQLILLITVILGLMLAHKSIRNDERQGVFLSLVLLSTFGAIVLSNAAHLVVLVLGIEIVSLPLYTLAAFNTSTT